MWGTAANQLQATAAIHDWTKQMDRLTSYHYTDPAEYYASSVSNIIDIYL